MLRCLAAALLLTAAGAAVAKDLEKDIADLTSRAAKGEGFVETVSLPPAATQLVQVRAATAPFHVLYVLDLKARLCFAGSLGGNIAPVPCDALKKGYPSLAPLITW